MASQKSKNTRELLLDSAFNIFYRQGFQGSNILEILSDVNINKGSMYYYFKSKKDLGIAVIQERIQKKIENKYTQILKNDNTIDALFESLQQAPQTLIYGCPLNKMSQEMSYIDKNFQLALWKVYAKFEDLIEQILSKAIKNNEIDNCDIKNTAKLIIATYEGGLMIYHLNQDKQAFIDILNILRIKL